MKYLILIGLLTCGVTFGQNATPSDKVWTERKEAGTEAKTLAAPKATPEKNDGGYSESRPVTIVPSPCAGKTASDAQTVLRQAQSLFIRSKAPYVRAHEIENALLKRRGFAALKIIITRNEGEADLVLELGHKYLTTRFFFTVIDPCGQTVVASGSVSSLFGTVDGKVADSFVKQVKNARAN